VALAKTLLHDPAVLLLDEPASGLDPHSRIQLRELLKRLGREGKTVLVSSHILTELSDFCTSVGIMDRGRLVVSGAIGEIAARLAPHRTLVVELLSDAPRALKFLEGRAEITGTAVDGPNLRVTFDGGDEAVADLLADLVRSGFRVKQFREDRLDLEDLFLQLGGREAS
jgi:ABC-2 type transport system ATP-binding protein